MSLLETTRSESESNSLELRDLTEKGEGTEMEGEAGDQQQKVQV